MRIFVTVKTRARQEKVERIDDTRFVVSVKEPPVDGRANAAVVAIVASHLDLHRSKVRIVSGHRGRQKVLEVLR